jgi:hypothetical protein
MRRILGTLFVAIANPGAIPATVTWTLLDSNGINNGSTTITIPPKSQSSQFVNQLFPAITAASYGILEVTTSASTPLAMTALYFPRGLFIQDLSSPSPSGAERGTMSAIWRQHENI